MKRVVLWIVAAAVAAIVVLSTPVSLLAQDINGASWAEITGDRVNVRAGASENYKPLRQAAKGEKVVVIGEQSGWARIQANAAVPCWISSSYVKKTGSTGIVTGSVVNLRMEPKAENARIGQAKRNDQVTIIGEQSGWYRIVPPPGVGVFIHGDFVKKLGPVSPADFAAWMGNKSVPDMTPRTDLASAVETPKEIAERKHAEQERETYDGLVKRYNEVLDKAQSGKSSSDLVAELERLAYEFRSFADSCRTEVGATASAQAGVLDQTRGLMKRVLDEKNASLREIKQREAQIAADEARRKAEQVEREKAEAIRKQAEHDAVLAIQRSERERLMARILYVEPSGYTAAGTIDDVRDDSGRKVYVLKSDGRVVCQLRLAPSAGDVNFAQLWQREVGIRGRIVTIDGEKWPVLVCDNVDAR